MIRDIDPCGPTWQNMFNERNEIARQYTTSETNRKPLIISICGNIGCGKTTILNMLSQRGYKCCLEGIKDWGDLLEKSYEDPKTYSLAFQLRIVSEQTLQREYINSLPDAVVLIERSSEDGRHVFLNAKHEQKYVDDVIVREFDRWIQIHHMGIHPDYTFYLRTTPEQAHDRIMKRHQIGDEFIDLEYLQMLHRLYDNYYLGNQADVTVFQDLSPEETVSRIIEVISDRY